MLIKANVTQVVTESGTLATSLRKNILRLLPQMI
jgi:hypothetical protein